MTYLYWVLSAVIGYLLGCIPTGVGISRAYGNLDIRKTGSGNTGTTNVLRTLGWLPSALTLLGDCLKGTLGALIGKWIGGEVGMLLGGLFAVLGHDFPVFMHFKGGKGIATSLGVTIVICPIIIPALCVVMFGVLALTRVMSVASLVSSAAYPILYALLLPDGKNFGLYVGFAVLLGALSVFCHRSNIRRILKGEEKKLDFHKITEISKKYAEKRRRGRKG